MLTMPPNKVAVEPIFDPDMIGSLYVPDSAKERCDQGIVKYVGGDCQYLKVGDHVLFSGYTGTLVNLEGEGLLIILPEEFATAVIYDDPYPVDGLFFRAKDGEYIPANHEQIFQLVARAYENNPTVRTSNDPKYRKIDSRPSVDDYSRLR